MNETSQHQLLCVASIDQASYKEVGPHEDDESLWARAVLAGPDGWARVLEAAKPQECDDRVCVGFIVKAPATDPITSAVVNFEEWTELCDDQVLRIWETNENTRLQEVTLQRSDAGPY